MKFEWDEHKRLVNLQKHGLDFEDAPRLFTDEAFVIEDRKQDYGEPRYILISLLFSRVILVSFTVRGDVTRIISMRKATKREQNAYVKNRFRKN